MFKVIAPLFASGRTQGNPNAHGRLYHKTTTLRPPDSGRATRIFPKLI